MRSLVALVVLRSHVRVHIPHHHNHASFLAVQAMHSMVVATVPGDDLALFPVVTFVGHEEFRPLQTRDAQVDVQDVVGRSAMSFHISSLLHLDDHHLLVLVRCPWQSGLGWEPLPEQSAGLGEDAVALISKLSTVIQKDTIPLPLLVEETIGILKTRSCFICHCSCSFLLDGGEMLFEQAADRQVLPGLSRPNGHAAKPPNPDLRRVMEVIPGHSFARGVVPLLTFPSHLTNLLKELLRLVIFARILQLQSADFAIQRHTATF
mmetsp:Transcript_44213/g.96175  ORF Transcript_44213/g.96175 Transcript_44213/m.96175 type:complete len:263 (+) Transcript_44213:122-910(+)